MSQGGAVAAMGDMMPPHDVGQVRNVLTMLLDAASQDGNVKKRDETAKRLEELYQKLAEGGMKTIASQKVLQLARAIESQDYGTANKLQLELCTIDWNLNRNWLMGVKSLMRQIPQR